MPHTAQHPLSKETRQCIEHCLDCSSNCWESANYCLNMGGKHAEASHVRLLLDCAEICRTTADFMLRGSELYQHSCTLCAEVCERCERSCLRFGDDAQMKACADLCRRTAESCRKMAGTEARRKAA